MRLLIYGGNSYSVRRSVGDWPPIPPGPLGDIYGLDSDTPAYGLGLLDDSPFLVFRRLQDVAGQRLYVITLLLDPGREVWERFGWNAAALICALVGAPDSLGNRLLEKPEEADAAALAEELKRLPLPEPKPADARASFRALWAGSTTSDEFVAAPCEEFGFASRPSPAEVAARLAALPPCFRTARGWLIGGSKGHAQAFGANLLVELRAEGGAAPCSDRVKDGESVLDAWYCVAFSEDKNALRDLARTPVWEWKRVTGHSPRQILHGLKLLAEAIKAEGESEPSDKLLGELTTYAGGPFKQEIHSALRRLVRSPVMARSAHGTRFVLRDYFDHEQEISPAVARLLDPDTVAEEFFERKLLPVSTRDRIDLPATTRLKVWQRFALNEQSVKGCVAHLDAAVDDLSRPPTEDGLASAKSLAESVFKSRGSEGEILQWWPLIEDSPIREHLEPLFRHEARERVRLRRKNWRQEYHFADDEDGSFLASIDMPSAEIQVLVEETIAHAEPRNAHPSYARWLDSVASSPLRKRLSLDTKLAIIAFEEAKQKNAATSAWRDFRELWDWYHGKGRSPAKPAQLDRERRETLMSELKSMALRHPNTKPALSAIVTALGGLSEDAVAPLKELRTTFDFSTAERWIQGWRDLGDNEHAALEARRLLTTHTKELPEKFSLGQYGLNDVSEIAPLFAELLFGGYPERDGIYRKRLRELLRLEQHRELLRRSLRQAVDEEANASKQTGDFARRFVGEREMLDLLFESLTPEQSVRLMKYIAVGQPNVFAEVEAYNFLTSLSSRSGGVKTIHYGKAFCAFLLSAEGGSMREEVTAVVNKGGRVDVKRVLRTYLNEHEHEGAEVGTSKGQQQSAVHIEKSAAKKNGGAAAQKEKAKAAAAAAKNESAAAAAEQESIEVADEEESAAADSEEGGGAAAPPPSQNGPRPGLLSRFKEAVKIDSIVNGIKGLKNFSARADAWLHESKDTSPPGDQTEDETPSSPADEQDSHAGAAATEQPLK